MAPLRISVAQTAQCHLVYDLYVTMKLVERPAFDVRQGMGDILGWLLI